MRTLFDVVTETELNNARLRNRDARNVPLRTLNLPTTEHKSETPSTSTCSSICRTTEVWTRILTSQSTRLGSEKLSDDQSRIIPFRSVLESQFKHALSLRQLNSFDHVLLNLNNQNRLILAATSANLLGLNKTFDWRCLIR
jgi:hypothetical protein